MGTVASNPLLGVMMHAVGAFFAATCYTPQRRVRGWSWQSYWLTQAAFCWLILIGHVRMGPYKFTSWAIHMIMLVLLSDLVGVVLREWRACRGRTRATVALALLVLVGAVLLLTYGNYVADQSAAASPSGH